MNDKIIIKGLKQNNLKNVSLEIPKNKIVVFTGVSGSGKSSIVFDTIASESQRQMNETYPAFVRSRMPKHEKPNVELIDNLTASVIIDQSRLGGNARSTVGTISDMYSMLRLLFSRIGVPYVGPASYFSFNNPNGMCPECSGIGKILELDVTKAVDYKKYDTEFIRARSVPLPSYNGKYEFEVYYSLKDLGYDWRKLEGIGVKVGKGPWGGNQGCRIVLPGCDVTLTDFVDGRVARKYNMVTDFGKMIEMEGKAIVKYTTEGKLLGHISIMDARFIVMELQEMKNSSTNGGDKTDTFVSNVFRSLLDNDSAQILFSAFDILLDAFLTLSSISFIFFCASSANI